MVANPEGEWTGWNCNGPEQCGKEPYVCEFAPGFECGFEVTLVVGVDRLGAALGLVRRRRPSRCRLT